MLYITRIMQEGLQIKRTQGQDAFAAFMVKNGFQWTGKSWSKTTGVSEKTLMAAAGLIPVAGPAFQQVQAAVNSVSATKPPGSPKPITMGSASPSFSEGPAPSKAGFSPVIAIVLVGVLVGLFIKGR